MKGLVTNSSLEKLDLSDNNISDSDSIYIVKFMKEQGEKRENTLWIAGLRQNDLDSRTHPPSHLQSDHIEEGTQQNILNLAMLPNSPY